MARTARCLLTLLVCALGAVAPACSERDDGHSLTIVASVPALAWIAQTVAPDAEVTLLMPPGVSPHGFELAPSQAVALRNADVVLLVGAGLEPRSVSDALRGVSESMVVLQMAESESAHVHDDHDDHGHAADAHYWLDPGAMRESAIRLSAALQRPAGSILERIDAIDAEYVSALAPYRGARIIGVHDAWSRLADRYGLDASASVMAQFELEPTPGAIEEAAAAIRADAPAVIVVEPQMDRSIAERLGASTGAPVVELDPLGTKDWPAMMRSNLTRLVDALARATSGAGAAERAEDPR